MVGMPGLDADLFSSKKVVLLVGIATFRDLIPAMLVPAVGGHVVSPDKLCFASLP